MAYIVTIMFAVAILIVVTRRSHPVRPATATILALLTGVWIWANLRRTAWLEDFGGGEVPQELDPITRAMFYRGWPLAPVMTCLFYFNRFQPSGLEGLALVIDWIVLFIGLYLVRFVCEKYSRWR